MSLINMTEKINKKAQEVIDRLEEAYKAARNAAWDAARGAATINTNLTDEKTLKFISIELPLLEALENGLGFFFPMQDKLILVPCPKITVNNKIRVHNEEGMAIEWKDKTGYYFLDGVRLNKKVWAQILTRRMNFTDVSCLENMEDRMIALKYNPNALLHQGKLLNKTERNELWIVEGFGTNSNNKVDAYFLKYSCPSTGRIYTKGVPPEIGKEKDADAAQAWSHWMSKEAYQLLEIES